MYICIYIYRVTKDRMTDALAQSAKDTVPIRDLQMKYMCTPPYEYACMHTFSNMYIYTYICIGAKERTTDAPAQFAKDAVPIRDAQMMCMYTHTYEYEYVCTHTHYNMYTMYISICTYICAKNRMTDALEQCAEDTVPILDAQMMCMYTYTYEQMVCMYTYTNEYAYIQSNMYIYMYRCERAHD